MVRAAVLVSGDGSRLQAILDSMYFNEIPDFELTAVISSDRGAYAMKRAASANVPAYVVDPELFPTATSYSMAIANKLRDMDVELVILADFTPPLGVIPYQFRNRIIGIFPALYPAFKDEEGDILTAVLNKGVKITGATAYFADNNGDVGPIILQKAVSVFPDDDLVSLSRRVTEEAEWELLPEAVSLYCAGRLTIHDGIVSIAPEAAD